MRIAERVLVITGGASGIGLTTAQLWQEFGGRAAILDIESPAGVVAGGTLTLQADVVDEVAMARALTTIRAEMGRIDAVFHNAGFLGPHKPLEDASVAEWRALCDVHLIGGFLLSKLSMPYLRESGGAVVFNTSIAALNGAPAHPAYGAAKAGLASLTLSLARSLGRYRIRVNAVAPGSIVGTRLLERSRGFAITPEETARLLAQIPLGRVGQPRDVAEAVCFLASPAAAHITGVVLPVDGGERLGR